VSFHGRPSRREFPLSDPNNPTVVGELNNFECGAIKPLAQFAFDE
jgi:hypothetical protein